MTTCLAPLKLIHVPHTPTQEQLTMSIVRIGMSEDKNFGDGYDAIFGTKPATAKKPAKGAKKPAAKAKKPAKKPAKKK